MSQLRFKIVINEGRHGAPLDKLGEIARETERFLRSLAEDLGLRIPKGEWIATNFKNNSVDFDTIHYASYDPAVVMRFNKGFHHISSFDPDKEALDSTFRSETLLQFTKIADTLDPDEHVNFGFYEGKGKKPKQWESLTKEKAIKIANELQSSIEHYGTVYGMIHALFKGAEPPYFTLREALSQDLIRCLFSDDLYKHVVLALNRRNATVYVFGLLKANKLTKKTEQVTVNRIEAAPELSDEDYKKFFGSAPNLTGSLSTEEYIDLVRSDEK